MKCKNTRYDHECHPSYAAMYGGYGGYCLDCANAGVPELDEQIADLRAQVFGHCERIAKQSELLSHKAEGCRGCKERDRQLAELRAQVPDENGRGDVHQQAQAWCLVYNEMLDWGLEKFMDELRDSGNGECGAIGAVKFIRRLAALLPPTAKEEQP